MNSSENHTLQLLREIRGTLSALGHKLDDRVDSFDKKIDRNHEELKQRIESLRQAPFGGSVIGRYTVAKIEERLFAIGRRVSALEQHK